MIRRFWIYLMLLSLLGSACSTESEGCDRDLPLNQVAGDPSVNVPFQRSSNPLSALLPPDDLTSSNALIESNGANRTYLIHIPATYNSSEPTPLIFSFHGRSQNASYQEALSGFSNPEWNSDAISIYPQGIQDQWQGDPESSDVDDVAFISEMITFVSQTYCIDQKRIFAAGKSNGGGFINKLACDPDLSTKIAAFAPVSAALYVPDVTDFDCVGDVPQTVVTPCSPGRSPVPILEFHGLQDMIILYTGGPRRGGCLPAILHWVAEWSARNGLEPDPSITNLNDGHVVKYEYAPGTDLHGVVTHFAIDNLDHDWPSVEPNGDNQNGTYLDATPIIMDFFNRFTL